MTGPDIAAKVEDCLTFSALHWPSGMSGSLRDAVDGLEQLGQARDLNDILMTQYQPA